MSLRRQLLSTLYLVLATSTPAWAWSSADTAQPQPRFATGPAQDQYGVVRFNAPAQWMVTGQWSPNFDRYVVRMQSPTGSMMLQLSDPSIPLAFPVPGAVPYMTGTQFAEAWMDRVYRRSGVCPVFQVTDRAEAPQPANLVLPAGAMIQAISSGYAFFTCTDANGRTFDGLAFATTALGSVNGVPRWDALWLWHFLADPARAAQAYSLARQVVDSIQVNQQALAALDAQAAASGAPSPGMTSGTGSQAMVEALNRSAINKFNAMHDNNMAMDETITNGVPTFNPGTGETFQRPYTQGNVHCANGLGGYTDQWAGPCPYGYTQLAPGNP